VASSKGKSGSASKPSKASRARGDEDARTARKEKVLHARIPDALDREIKGRARNLGLSVSTVVRHILMHTFELVEGIVSDSTDVALAITGDSARSTPRAGSRATPASTSEAGVIGWQQIVLQRNAVCDHCNAILKRGSQAALGVHEVPSTPTIVCLRCLDSLTLRPDSDDAD